jgi:hypothetical protein
LVRVESETPATIAGAEAAAVAVPMISAFDIMMRHGKSLPVDNGVILSERDLFSPVLL